MEIGATRPKFLPILAILLGFSPAFIAGLP
jgi:hypothetical protein